MHHADSTQRAPLGAHQVPGLDCLGGVEGRDVGREVRAKKSDAEWQLLQSFIGYFDRHLGKYIDSIAILYYPH